MRPLLRFALCCGLPLLLASCRGGPDPSRLIPVSEPPRIDPDYTSLVVPPNIAPLNFRIREEGRDYWVRLSSDGAPAVQVHCPEGNCRFDLDTWQEVLARNRGGRIYLEVFAEQQDGAWRQYPRITNQVAEEPIDPWIVYRQLAPNSQLTVIRGIYQRSLEDFDRSPLVTLRDNTFTCVNCHSFHRHDPERFLFHIRGKQAGTMLVMDGRMRKVETQQGPMFRPLAYSSWHPDGRHVAATLNMYITDFPATDLQCPFQAVEKRGDLVVFDTADNTIHTTSAVFGNEYIETHPSWSADGRSIYFARCRDRALLSRGDLAAFRADLMRIAYDVDTETWGVPETVVAYSEKGKSCAFPCPSPDGRYVLHILAAKATFPIYQSSSDIYLLDLVSGEYRRLATVSSDGADSFARWSSNGRWISLLSSRGDGRSALPYFAYFDTQGEAHKAFVLPQEDPAYYDTFTDTYNLLELVTSRVKVDPFELASAMQRPAEPAHFPNAPQVDATTAATREALGYPLK
ncbi:MAG: hypothetical protein WDA75_15680 [Candidatus Latescibacterota bacterium]|jgi:hypothetical protein